MNPPTRRQFLGAATLAAVSGCVGRDGGDDTTPTSGPETDETGGGGGDSGSDGGSGDSSGGGGGRGNSSDGGGVSGDDSGADNDTVTDGDDTRTDGRDAGTTASGNGDDRDCSDPVEGATGDVSPSYSTSGGRLPLPMEPDELREEAESVTSKGGIPAVDRPNFTTPDDVDFLAAEDPVFGVVRDGTAKAYPQKILAQHEIVNDELAGTNVAVTYCPLTGTVQGFERGERTFSVSGWLINNNLVMFDEETETWWPQILATSIPGPWNENPEIRSLPEFRLVWTTWERWREHNPETKVMSRATGFARNYGDDPYGSYNPRGGYYEKGPPLFLPLHDDDRYQYKTVVMGARTPDGAAAFLKDTIRDRKVMSGSIADTSIIAVYDPRLDTAYVYRNPDEKSYELDGCGVTGPDGETHSPDSLPLDRIHTFDAMWFAWAGYYPDTNLYE